MNDNTDPEIELTPGVGLPAQLKPVLGETLESFEGFVCYFNLGHERSLRLVAKKLDFNLSTVKDWSSKFHWVERILSYEAQLFSNCVAAKSRSAAEQAVAKSAAQAQFQQTLAGLSHMAITAGQNIIQYVMVHKPGTLTNNDGVQLVKLGLGARKVEVESMGDAGPREQEAAALCVDLKETIEHFKARGELPSLAPATPLDKGGTETPPSPYEPSTNGHP